MKRIIAFLLVALLPTLAFGQAETSGRLTGTVVDEAQAPIEGAQVWLDSPAMQGERTLATDSQGRFLASLLPPGLYTVQVSAPQKTPRQFTVRLGVGQTVPLDIVLKTGEAIQEEVDVFAPAAKMETTAGGENFNYKETVDFLPVTNRTIDNVAFLLAPNISIGPTQNADPNVAPTIQISGAPSYDNAVLLDGSDIGDPFYSSGVVIYVEEAIEEVQVLTNGISARYGRFQGGVLNATTKSGGNTFDGTARADLAKQTWNQKTPFIDANGNREPQSDSLDKVYSATFGGPILKDHLWFFLGGRTIPERSFSTPTLVTAESFTSVTNEDRFQVKLTGAVNANHTVEASYLDYSRDETDRDPFAWAAESEAVIPLRTDPREYYTVEYEGVLTQRAFLTVQLAKKDVSIRSGGDPSGPSPLLEFIGGQYQAYANGWFDPNDPSVRNSETAAAAMTHSFDSGDWGSHTLEYGLQYVNSITAGDNRQSPTGFNLYLNTPTGANQTSFADCDLLTGDCLFTLDETQWFNQRLKAIPGAGEQDLKNTAIFVQDTWERGKWRFDLGLRYENWKGEAISPALNIDFNALAPRLGVTYNLSPQWQFQATYGKYVSRFNDSVANGVSGISSIFGPGIMQEYSGAPVTGLTAAQVDAILRDDSQWGAILAYVNPLQPTSFFADDVNAAYANEVNLTVKRALSQNHGVLTLTYTNREYEDLLEQYVGGIGVINVTLPDSTTTAVDRLVWDNCDQCRRDYESISATWDYHPGARWNVGGNYTLAKSKGNYEGELNGQPSIGSIIGNYPNAIGPEAVSFPYGDLAGDVRHRFRGWGDYRFGYGNRGRLTLGGILNYQSGQAYSHTVRVPTTIDPADGYIGAPSSYVAYFGGRGTENFNGWWSLDGMARYDVNFWKDLGTYVKLDVRNVTNEDELVNTRIGGTVGPGGEFVKNANYGTAINPISYQVARTFRVSVGLNW